MSHSNLCAYLRFRCRVIVKALKNDSLTMVSVLADEDIAMYQESIRATNLSTSVRCVVNDGWDQVVSLAAK